jgi:hypothetical protein
LPLKGHLYSGLLVKNSLPVINPLAQSAITTTGTFTVEGGKKVIQPAQIYVFVDDSVTSDNAKNVFVPIVNTPSPFVDPKPVQIDDPTPKPIDGMKLSAIEIITELRTRFGLSTKKSIDNRQRQQIESLPIEAKQLLLQLQLPIDNPNINDTIVQQLKSLNLPTFSILMNTLHSILGSDFSYDKNGNNIKNPPKDINKICK